jgi:hypothetical protein
MTELLVRLIKTNPEQAELYLRDHPNAAEPDEDYGGVTPLYAACDLRRNKALAPRLVRALLQNNVAVDRGSRGVVAPAYPIFRAAFTGQVEVLGLLLEAGADYNMVCPITRDTPLRYAIRNQQAWAVTRLLEVSSARNPSCGGPLMHSVLCRCRTSRCQPRTLCVPWWTRVGSTCAWRGSCRAGSLTPKVCSTWSTASS